MSARRKKNRGVGTIFKRPDSPYWWLQYSKDGVRHREPSGSPDEEAAQTLLLQRLSEGLHDLVGVHLDGARQAGHLVTPPHLHYKLF